MNLEACVLALLKIGVVIGTDAFPNFRATSENKFLALLSNGDAISQFLLALSQPTLIESLERGLWKNGKSLNTGLKVEVLM